MAGFFQGFKLMGQINVVSTFFFPGVMCFFGSWMVFTMIRNDNHQLPNLDR